LFGAALLGALLLFVAEFTTLYTERIATYHAPATVVQTGPHDSYAMVPIAILAVILAGAVLRAGSRPALLAVGIAGLVALLIALLGDLPDSHAAGLVTGPGGQFISAVSDPGVGMYLETLGAVVLIATSGLGFILIGRPGGERRLTRRALAAPSSPADPGAEPGANTGSDLGANTGSNPGAKTGSDPGAETGSDPGAETGPDTPKTGP